jgi:hypothetical protein
MRKLDSIEPMRGKEELELLEIFRYMGMTDKSVAKGLEGEEFAEAWLDEEYGAKNIINMTYPKELTETNNLIVDALEGREFHNYEWEKDNPEKPKYWDRYREVALKKDTTRTDVLHIYTLLKNLEDMALKEPLYLIGEIQERTKKLNAYDFLNLLGELKGTKIDFIAVENGGIFIDAKDWDSIVKVSEKKEASAKELMSEMERMIKASVRRIIFFDAKWWDNKHETPIVNMRELEMQMEFANKGIPFYLLFWNEGRRNLYGCDIKNLPLKFKGKYYKIPKNTKKKKYLCLLKSFPRESPIIL